MKVVCGTDIVEVSRIKDAIEENKNSFIQRVFTQQEIKYCESKKVTKYEHYAGKFAAKEAIFKALSKQLNNKYDISWKNMQIVNDEEGKPYVDFIGISFPKVENIDISISHVKETAVASVVALVK